jgi:diguanylate cyclase (GGDEF)-like protein/PAS domain S-box-containing protein
MTLVRSSARLSSRLGLAGLMQNAPLGILFTRSREFYEVNHECAQMLGYLPEELLGQPAVMIYPDENVYLALGLEAAPVLAAGKVFHAEAELRRKDGSRFWCRMQARAIDPAQPGQGTLWFLEDVAGLHEIEEKLQRALADQQLIFDNAAIGIAFMRDRVIQRCNPWLAAMTGHDVGYLLGKSARVLFWSEADYQQFVTASATAFAKGDPAVSELPLRQRDGTVFWAQITSRRVPGAGDDVISTVKDISAQHAAEQALLGMQEQLEARVAERTAELETAVTQLQQEVFERLQAERRVWEMAHHDGLTGLPNRTLLHDRLGQALEQAQRDKKRATVMFIDLDRFKSINDTLGHAVGDELLQAVAQRLRSVVRAVDTVSRFGGDEFVIVLHEIASPDDAVLVAEKILVALSPPVCLAGSVIRITPSIGIAVYPDDGMDAVMLMKNADTAMYHAKAVGRNNFQFFSRQMNEQASRFFEMEHRLQQAIDAGQLLLHYQPLIDWSRRAVCGMEALVRWNDPEHGLISPTEFIPVAEESGLIIPLGEWVLRTALEQNRQWQQEGRALVPISVNLSPRQFRQKDLVDSVRRILADTGQPASLLELEITESSLMHDVTETTARLHELAAMGVRVAIDDFGTGYSSLAYLKRFPVHKLKVDQSFVRDLTTDPDDVAIVTAVIGLASSMGLDLLAEGVECQEQLDVLLGLGCGKFQGYFFSRPLPATAVDAIFSPPRLQDSRP